MGGCDAGVGCIYQAYSTTRYRGNKNESDVLCVCLAPPTSLSGFPYRRPKRDNTQQSHYRTLTALCDEGADFDSPCSRLLRILHFSEG